MNAEASRLRGYRQLAKERREAIAKAEQEARDSIEVVASLGSGKPSIIGKTLGEVGQHLLTAGYDMSKAKPEGEPGKQKLVVPHRDGFKKAVVKIRVNK